jgi:hypothetical protein
MSTDGFIGNPLGHIKAYIKVLSDDGVIADIDEAGSQETLRAIETDGGASDIFMTDVAHAD